jgi:hypothetical protein
MKIRTYFLRKDLDFEPLAGPVLPEALPYKEGGSS